MRVVHGGQASGPVEPAVSVTSADSVPSQPDEILTSRALALSHVPPSSVPSSHVPASYLPAAGTLTDLDGPFCRLAALAATVFDAPAAFVALRDALSWQSRTSVCPPSLLAESFRRNVLSAGSPLVVRDALTDARTRGDPWVAATGYRSWACRPMTSPTGDALGMFCVLDTRPRGWQTRDVEMLTSLASAGAGEFASLDGAATAAAEVLGRQKLQGQLRALQHSLLPPSLPEVPGMAVAARYLPAADGLGVLGDFYDVFSGAGGRWAAVIGDVCGHGVAAAALTALARYTIRAEATHAEAPAQVLGGLNTALLAQRPGSERFLTAAYVALSPAADGIDAVVTSAGHTPVLLRTANGTVRPVGCHGLPLGLFDSADLRDTHLSLRPGDRLLLYTDGVVEARRGREQYGDERLRALLAGAADLGAAELARAVEQDVLRFTGGPHTDDIAVLVLHVRSPADPTDPTDPTDLAAAAAQPAQAAGTIRASSPATGTLATFTRASPTPYGSHRNPSCTSPPQE